MVLHHGAIINYIMNIFLRTILLLAGVSVLHFAGVYFGVYDYQIRQGNVWFDNVLHVLDGAIFAYAWISYKENRATLLSVITFVVALALGWEIIEYAFMALSPTYAVDLKIYSPSLSEAGQDIISNTLGGLAAFFLLRK